MSDYTSHEDYRNFLRTIRARPDDDLPRMILADWLEDHDPERAEFIRLSIERYRWVPSDICHCGQDRKDHWYGNGADHDFKSRDSTVIEQMYDRVSTLLQKNSRRWTPGPSLLGLVWSRGFIDIVRCPIDAFNDRSSQIASSHPVRGWRITDRVPETTHFRRYRWFGPAFDMSDPSRLPEYLWKRLSHSTYVSLDTAYAALSHACVQESEERSERST